MKTLLLLCVLCASVVRPSALPADDWVESHREASPSLATRHSAVTPGVTAETSSNTWQTAYHAAARINAGDGWGSGAVFRVDRASVYVLTNAHVVGRAKTVHCEFFHRGYKSAALTGRVVARVYNEAVDAAIVAVPVKSFEGRLPAVLAIGGDPQPGQTIVTVGCPRADWPSLWQGHIVGRLGDLHVAFTPGGWPLGAGGGDMMSGRSGSALLDETGQTIVGLVAWSDGSGRGGAMPISYLMRSAEQAWKSESG